MPLNAPLLTVIGSGTLVPSARRASPCCLLESSPQPAESEPPVARVLLDVGPGAVHGLAGHDKRWWDVSHVVISHYHTDHFGDLPHLLFALKWASPTRRDRPLQVIGPPGLAERAKALRAAHGDFIADPGFEVAYHELDRNARWADDAVGLELAFAPTPHTDHSVAVRVRFGGADLGFTGDTGPEPALGPFFQGVDVLVAECAHADPSPAPNHLTPRSAAALANAARPRTLVLVHLYPSLDPGAAPGLIRAAGYEGETVCAEDGQAFLLRRTGSPLAVRPSPPAPAQAPAQAPARTPAQPPTPPPRKTLPC